MLTKPQYITSTNVHYTSTYKYTIKQVYNHVHFVHKTLTVQIEIEKLRKQDIQYMYMYTCISQHSIYMYMYIQCISTYM